MYVEPTVWYGLVVVACGQDLISACFPSYVIMFRDLWRDASVNQARRPPLARNAIGRERVAGEKSRVEREDPRPLYGRTLAVLTTSGREVARLSPTCARTMCSLLVDGLVRHFAHSYWSP